MRFSMPRVIASVAVAGVAGMLAFTALNVTDRQLPPVSQAAVAGAATAAPGVAAGKAQSGPGGHVVQVSAPGKPYRDRDMVHVAAPSTRVDVEKTRGKVRVQAPYTNVKVDPDRGRVRVRAPYVNLDIDW